MFLHLGSDVSVALKDVIAINDYSYLKTINKEFLKNMIVFFLNIQEVMIKMPIHKDSIF